MGKKKDRKLVRQLVERLPECAFCYHPATCAEHLVSGRYVGREFEQRYCDEHAAGRPDVEDLSYAWALRQLLARMEEW